MRPAAAPEPDLLPGDYVAGLVDGEGCFFLGIRRTFQPHKSLKEYLSWNVRLIIVMHRREKPILDAVRRTLGCGLLYEQGNRASLTIYSTDDLKDKVIPFFSKFPLRAAKRYEFEIWKRAVQLIARNRAPKDRNAAGGRKGFRPHVWSHEDISELLSLREHIARLKGSPRPYKWQPEVTSGQESGLHPR